jgi:hypothetical protein
MVDRSTSGKQWGLGTAISLTDLRLG